MPYAPPHPCNWPQLKPLMKSRIFVWLSRYPFIRSAIPSAIAACSRVSGCFPRSLTIEAYACCTSPASTYSMARFLHQPRCSCLAIVFSFLRRLTKGTASAFTVRLRAAFLSFLISPIGVIAACPLPPFSLPCPSSFYLRSHRMLCV